MRFGDRDFSIFGIHRSGRAGTLFFHPCSSCSPFSGVSPRPLGFVARLRVQMSRFGGFQYFSIWALPRSRALLGCFSPSLARPHHAKKRKENGVRGVPAFASPAKPVRTVGTPREKKSEERGREGGISAWKRKSLRDDGVSLTPSHYLYTTSFTLGSADLQRSAPLLASGSADLVHPPHSVGRPAAVGATFGLGIRRSGAPTFNHAFNVQDPQNPA